MIGVRSGQAKTERLLLFAPRFFRANVGIVTQAFGKGPGADEARKGLGALLAGATALTIGVHYKNTGRLPVIGDPFDPAWMKARVGDSYFNFMGPFYTLFRTIARASARTADGKPMAAAAEIGRYFENKASVPFRAIQTAMEVALLRDARDADGRIINMTPGGIGNFFAGYEPISGGQAVRGMAQGRPEAVAGLTGLNIYDSAFAQMDIKFRAARDINPNNASIAEAEPWQKDEMARRFPEIDQLGLETARGLGGRARRSRAQIDRDAAAYLQSLAKNNRLSRRTLVEEYYNTESAVYNQKLGVDRGLGIEYGEAQKPEGKLLNEWYALGDSSEVNPNEVFDADKLESARRKFLASKTRAEQEYILRNTNLGSKDVPDRIRKQLPYDTKRRFLLSESARLRATTQLPAAVGQ